MPRVWLALRMAPWSLAVPVLKHTLPLPTLVRLMWSAGSGPRDRPREEAIAKAAWWASRIQPRRFPDNCLERSLVAYRYLARAGANPWLVLGVRHAGTQVIGHAWVTVDGTPIHDSADAVRSFAELVRFGPRGRAIDGAGQGRAVAASIAWR